jgi:RHS repeat-associated protein
VTTSYTYDAYGNATSSTAGDTNPVRYTGRESGPGLPDGLQGNRSRYYSPRLHRFISQDPLRFGGGDTNLYAYAAGDPVDFTDPFGETILAGCLIGAAIDVGIGLMSAGRKYTLEDLGRDALQGCVTGAIFSMVPLAIGALGTLRTGGRVAAGVAAADAGAAAARSGGYIERLVIGRTKDLTASGALRPGEYTLLPKLSPNLGCPKANWTRNSSVLRDQLRKGVKRIRDASPGDTRGQFLNAERNVLRNRGWTHNEWSGEWLAPGTAPTP